ncbi:MAG: hypothetical protein WCC10_11100, partial [Tumebacillaceae bacterium]
MIGNMSIKQVLTLAQNANTNRQDTVEIKYVVTNKDTRAHSYGMRIMMDTMLGDNDAAPFRIPGTGAVTTEKEFVGSAIPEYFQAFDDLTRPTVISQGTLKSTSNPPDKVQFTNWGGVYNTPWNYPIHPYNANGDSAVSMIWNSKTLNPGETLEFTTYYGLADFSQDLRPPVAVSLTGASSVAATESGYNPNPFTVTAYLKNVGSATALNTKATLNLPEGLHLANGQNATVSVGNMTVNAERQLSWNVVIDPAKTDRILNYSVTVTGDNTDTKTVSRSITIPAFMEAVKTPVFSIQPGQPDGENGWYKHPCLITLGDGTEPSGTKFQYRIVTSSGAGEWLDYTGPFTPDQNGAITIEYRAISPSGVISEPGSTSLKLDTAAPKTDFVLNPSQPIGSNGWYNGPVSVDLSANDGTSGVANTEYRIIENGQSAPAEWTAYTGGSIVLDHNCSCKIEYRSTDKAGNTEETKSQVINIDQSAPTLSLELDNTVLWPPNHKYVPIHVTVNAADDLSGIASVVLTSITSNEPDEGLGDGDQANDVSEAEFGTFDTSFSVRAERSGLGKGRVYTVTYTATDYAGNVTTATATITVPHDQSAHNAN